MQIVVLDFETYYAPGYSLKGVMDYGNGAKRRATTEAYVRDPKFDPICCCLFVPGSNLRASLPKPQIKTGLAGIDWSNTIALAHHAQFDGLILSHHYGIKPAYWLDTYSMASAILGNHIKVGLESLALHFKLTPKTVPYNLFYGKHYEELTPPELDFIMAGCMHDCQLTWEVYRTLLNQHRWWAKAEFPTSELDLIDMTVRWFTEPMVVADMPLLGKIYMEEQQAKNDALAAVGVTEKDVRSDARLIELFTAAGVDVAYKPGSSGPIPCFAATDEWLRELCDDDDDYVSALATARVRIKSNAVQSRADTLGWMASRGALPIYIRYCGAHTTRWSGGDGSNFQNNKRGHAIRRAQRAPDGYLFAAPDASQIECRILNTVAGQHDVVERFRTGADPYLALASAIYERPITRTDVPERGTGKQGELSCGYMAGASTFQRTAARGAYGPPAKISLEFAERCVQLYRSTHRYVTAYWHIAGEMIQVLAHGQTFIWGPMEIHDKRVWLPSGLCINYETLEWSDDSQEWVLLTRNGRVKMYSGKLVENVIQALARCKIAEDMLEIQRSGLRVVGMSHDEPWVMIPEGPTEEQALAHCIAIMSRPAKWLPDCPFAAEGLMGKAYPK